MFFKREGDFSQNWAIRDKFWRLKKKFGCFSKILKWKLLENFEIDRKICLFWQICHFPQESTFWLIFRFFGLTRNIFETVSDRVWFPLNYFTYEVWAKPFMAHWFGEETLVREVNEFESTPLSTRRLIVVYNYIDAWNLWKRK